MKKTLFLSVIFGFSASAFAATDCLMPQTIIKVIEGTATQGATKEDSNVSISTKNDEDEDKTVSELMTQEALTMTDNRRPAVVKDGEGTLEITEDVGTLNTTLVVREGTLHIKGATVSTLGSKNGNNLVIGGINAKMVLSNEASYTFTKNDRTSSSVNVGGIDGDGTLILTGGSTLSTRQTLFSGSATKLPIPTSENPYWDAGPHYGGTYAKVDGEEGNSYYRVATNAAGYSNQTTTPMGSMTGTAVITVEDGSTLTTGTGFYVGNTTLTIDNATVNSGTVNNSDNVWIGSSEVFGPTSKAVVNITNGGQWLAQNGQYAAISYYAGEQSEINISGKDSEGNGSLMHVTNLCYLGSNNTSKSAITISEGGKLEFDSYIYARGSADSRHTILVDGEGSKLSASAFYLYGATSLTVRNGGLAKATNLQATRSDVAVTVEAGSKVELTGQLDIDNCTLDNNGTVETKNGTIIYANGTLKGSGTIKGNTAVVGTMIVGNSPGAPTFEGDLELLSKSKTIFSVAGLTPYTGTKLTGWESGEYSHITITSGGSLTLEDGAEFVIEFGGDIVETISSSKEFDLALITVEDGTINLSAAALTSLLNNTSFLEYQEGKTSPLELNRNNLIYTIEKGNELHLKRVPEPATATLSLLALAALAARRKRK